ncbi:MAG: cell division protein ZapD [Chromatiales bacterium]|nr:cell division protein ZapD [Chromatiales bacterium]
MPSIVVYEHPLTERMRSLLRLEHLFGALEATASRTDPFSQRGTVFRLLDLSGMFARYDLKTEILKELERHTGLLAPMRGQAEVDGERLDRVLDELGRASDEIAAIDNHRLRDLRQHEMLNAISQRYNMPGGTCSFDLPDFHQWLVGPAEVRDADLARWLAPFEPLHRGVRLSLKLSRASARPAPKVASGGFYQQSLDASKPLQLIRVALTSDDRCYPQISGNKHRFTVRFVEPDSNGHACATEIDTAFQLTCCLI